MTTQYGTWTAFSGWEMVILVIVLFVITALLFYFGTKFTHPLGFAFPGKALFSSLLLLWILSIVTFLNNVSAYIIQLVQTNMVGFPPFNPVAYVTYSSVFVTFIFIFILTRKSGLIVSLFSAFICAVSATMIFELPFDLIIISRTYPPIPPSPEVFRGVFFLPLFLIEISTLSLLMFSPLMKINKLTFFSLAGMFLIFALWAILGFAYPTNPLLLTCNIVSKLFAFLTAISLFLPQKFIKKLA